MKTETKKAGLRYLLTGGGTAGHVYPALALGEHIRKTESDAQFLYVGAKGGAEERIVPAAGHPLCTLSVKGLPSRAAPVRSVAVLAILLKAVVQAARLVRSFRPDVIIGTGGFGDNPKMINKYTKHQYGKDMFPMKIPGMLGEGIRMAWEAGAAKDETRVSEKPGR